MPPTELPANAQAHLLAAFQARIPVDSWIPADSRYRQYAEKVLRRPLPRWQAMTIEEARVVFKHLSGSPALPVSAQPDPELALGVLRRVERHKPLNHADHAQVLALIAQGLMHVTPEFDRKDVCPYRLTAAGQAALRTGQVGA